MVPSAKSISVSLPLSLSFYSIIQHTHTHKHKHIYRLLEFTIAHLFYFVFDFFSNSYRHLWDRCCEDRKSSNWVGNSFWILILISFLVRILSFGLHSLMGILWKLFSWNLSWVSVRYLNSRIFISYICRIICFLENISPELSWIETHGAVLFLWFCMHCNLRVSCRWADCTKFIAFKRRDRRGFFWLNGNVSWAEY